MALYALLECVSLVYMHVLLSFQLEISAMHLLAFVLERDVVMLQSVFMAWVIVILQFTLEHNGRKGIFEADSSSWLACL